MGQIGYFSKFPRIQYPYNGKLVKDDENFFVDSVDCIDLTVRFRFIERLKNEPLQYLPYEWKDGDRPDNIAYLYYGDEKYAWVVMLSAQIFDWIYELPLESGELDQFLENHYVGLEVDGTEITNINDLQTLTRRYETGSGEIIDEQTYTNINDPDKRIVVEITNINDLQILTHHYETGNGLIIDEETYININDPDKRIVTIWDFEVEANESKRSVKLINDIYLTEVVNEFEQAMSDIIKQRRKAPITFSQSE